MARDPSALVPPARSTGGRAVAARGANPLLARQRAQADLLGRGVRTAAPHADADVVQLLLWTTRLGRLVDAFLAGALAGTGLDASRAAVLMTLLLYGPDAQLPQSLLTRTVVQSRGGMTKTLRRLEADGLVVRVDDPHDGRGILVRLTPDGRATAEATLDQAVHRWNGVLALVPELDVRASSDTLGGLAAALAAVTGH